MLDGDEGRLARKSVAWIVCSFLVPLLLQACASTAPCDTHVALATDVSSVVRRDSPAPRDDDAPAEPTEEIAPESVENDSPSSDSLAVATLDDSRLRLFATVAHRSTAAPREGDVLRRLTATASVRGPPRV
jgi:hypothetical protein